MRPVLPQQINTLWCEQLTSLMLAINVLHLGIKPLPKAILRTAKLAGSVGWHRYLKREVEGEATPLLVSICLGVLVDPLCFPLSFIIMLICKISVNIWGSHKTNNSAICHIVDLPGKLFLKKLNGRLKNLIATRRHLRPYCSYFSNLSPITVMLIYLVIIINMQCLTLLSIYFDYKLTN